MPKIGWRYCRFSTSTLSAIKIYGFFSSDVPTDVRRKVQISIAFKRLTYQHRNTQYTLFYAIPSWAESYWAIAATNQFTAQNPGLYGKVKSVVLCPEQITETEWSEYSYRWISSYIQIQCVSSAGSGIPELEPDVDISDLNDTDSSLLNYTLAYDIQANELKMIIAMEIFSNNDGTVTFKPIEQSEDAGVFSHTGPKKAQLANDPRDMFFVLPNFNQLWYSQQPGSSIYSSNYEGGIFTTDEGYQFELQIFLKELDNNLITS